MKNEFPKTLEIISQPAFSDAWWVSINGNTAPEPQTLEQAVAQKKPRSRSKVLVLHVSLSDEWIPVLELESLVSRYAFDPNREASINKELENFRKELASDIEFLMDGRGMLRKPSPDEMKVLLASASNEIRWEGCPETQEMLRTNCPQCFHPIWVQNPDAYEDVAAIHESFAHGDAAYDPRFLFSRSDVTIDDVLKKPSIEQLASVIAHLNKGKTQWDEPDQNGDDFQCNRRLAKAIAKRYPELIKDSPKARDFFDPQPKARGGSMKGKPPPLIQSSKSKDGKKTTTITIGPVTIVILLLLGVFIFKKCS